MRMNGEQREERRKAYLAVRWALRTKKLVRQPCEVCGDTLSEAHHRWGYAEPLRVVWLCAIHHQAEHRAMRLANPAFYRDPRHWQYSEGTGPALVVQHMERLMGLLHPRERQVILQRLARIV